LSIIIGALIVPLDLAPAQTLSTVREDERTGNG
jgi:hypothetical protein